MKTIAKNILLLLLLTFCGSVSAQISELHYFSDTISGHLDQIYDYHEVEDGIIVTGKLVQVGADYPVILKINTNGDTLWSTQGETVPTMVSCYEFNTEIFSDGYIYGIVSGSNGYPDNLKVLWKVNAANGTVAWTKNMNVNYFNTKSDLADYDANHIIAAYYSTNGRPTLGVYNKLNGNLVSSKEFTQGATEFSVAVDYNKNVIYSRDEVLLKFNRRDFNQIIWEKNYPTGTPKVNAIHDIYLDEYDNLYFFGENGSPSQSGTDNIFKVDISTGEKIWGTTTMANHTMVDFVDFQGHIYAVCQQVFVGGGTYRFCAYKINKQTGVLAWSVYQAMPTVGTPASHSGNSQSGLSIDVDCSGDVYLTGYYGDANYGPEAWGNMKLNGNNGSVIYAPTVTATPGPYDDLSSGVAVCVFGDSPIILGHLEYATYKSKATYLKINPSDGSEIKRKFIDGGGYQPASQTLDIINNGGDMYVLKQQGFNVVVERRTSANTLVWTRTFKDDGMLRGGQMQVVNSYVYFTACHVGTTTTPPYYNSETDKLKICRLNKTNGAVSASDSLTFASGVVVPFELEADQNQAFVFYRKDGSVYYFKWVIGTNLAPQLFEPTSPNSNYTGGEVNMVKNLNATTLLLAGRNKLYSINKSTMTQATVYSYGSAFSFKYFYDLLTVGDTLYLSGSTGSTQTILALNLNNYTLKWERTYGAGTIYKTVADGNNRLYSLQKSGQAMGVRRISGTTGLEEWNYLVNATQYPVSTPSDLEINTAVPEKYLVLAGAKTNSATQSDALLQVLNLEGDTLYSFLGTDGLASTSKGYTLAYASDSNMWAGGSWNRAGYGKRGFIFSLGSPWPVISASTNTVSLCVGQNFTVAYQVSASTLDPANIFTVQLSNASGSFAAPAAIGTLASAAASGTINAVIPAGMPTGTSYRIRVVSNSPSYASPDNGVNITITALPAVHANAISSTPCANSQLAIPLVGTPAGGTWTGPGVSGVTFIPSVAGGGIHDVIYTYANQAGCQASDTISVSVNALPVVQASPISSTLCENSQQAVPLVGSPAGGTWSGPGVSGSIFTPSVAGDGVHSVIYTYVNQAGCQASDTLSVSVTNLPFVQANPISSTFCDNSQQAVSLIATPSGGTWSGAGVSGSTFRPLVAGDGIHTVVYTYAGVAGCEASDSISITVHALPVVTLSTLGTTCVNHAQINLTGGNPVGGIYSGTAVNAGIFNPTQAGVGIFTITYTYTDANGCSNASGTSIEVSACAGIESFNELDVRVYPNPTDGVVYISGLKNQQQIYTVKNVWGQWVMQGTLGENGSVDLGTLASGTYILQIENRHWKIIKK